MVRLPIENSAKRYKFYSSIARTIGKRNIGFIALQHCLKDLPHLLHALSEIGEVLAVVCIPYSMDENVFQEISSTYKTFLPEMDQLHDNTYLREVICTSSTSKDVVLVEVGGYFSQYIDSLNNNIDNRIIGIIEDTEAGHRKYASRDDLQIPVVSVARSPLKAAEDAVIGPASIFSIEKSLRAIDRPIDGMHATVLGYGKIGRGAAFALRTKNCVVSVFDINPIARINALADGYKVPRRDIALSTADLIIGASGYQSLTEGDLATVKSGVILASCSSKQVEFDVKAIRNRFTRKNNITDRIASHESSTASLLLLCDGMPVNFNDGSVVGPLISIVHAEIILSIGKLLQLHSEAIYGLRDSGADIKQLAANLWLSEFIDERSGRYADFA